MRENRVRTLLTDSKPVLNGWLMLPSSLSAELMAQAGFDSLTVDMQHGMIDFPCALSMLTAISTTSVTPIVRVPWLDPGIIMKMLDAGAYGIICPMINSREDAELLVASTHYAPRGKRSWGPLRAVLYAGTDYLSGANDTVLNFAMIETAQAVDRIDEICSVEGLDAIYVGPGDLSLSLTGRPQADTMEGEVGDAIRYILAKAKEHGVFPCTHTSSPQFARKMLDLGFRFVTCSNDSRLITAGANDAVAQMKV
ncbi:MULTISPECIES: HpcH/HpaI aldolase family protein [unclassified Caballeronia]|uniref:HpcH/HpaI aldolase family protein n=1 Tax=unclassified Caballeronia TaxID=2646786 RepID=UPI003ECED65A